MSTNSSPLFRLLSVATTKTRNTNRSLPTKYNLQISCNVKPNAAGNRDGITDIGTDAVDVCVAAAPRNGEANAAVSRLFAQILRVPKSNVDVIRGLKSRQKVLCITELDIGPEKEEKFLQNIRQKLQDATIKKS